MNALADKAHKQGMPHSDMHSITRLHYSTTCHEQIPCFFGHFICIIHCYHICVLAGKKKRQNLQRSLSRSTRNTLIETAILFPGYS